MTFDLEKCATVFFFGDEERFELITPSCETKAVGILNKSVSEQRANLFVLIFEWVVIQPVMITVINELHC